ncbi:S41 family peptidase, partial [Porphyromonas cangingivalis]|uniref:S41 family peptidase n=1 Tax=Porphyromonas cangingivalis TaxID=36874 RepID=UPI002432B28E
MEIRRSTQVFQYVLSGVESLYVDTLNIKDMTSKGINAMLSQLDPYTEYMTDTESKDFEFMTTGIYGGIGAYIQEKDSAVYVQNPMPGSPAEKSGLKRGDKFVIIEGVSVIPGNVSKVSDLLKGPVGTKVKVKVLRLGEEKEREVTLTRESVVVDQVVHRGIYGDNIGYINLISFTNRSASDVRNAFNELNRDRKLKGLILDLRSNGGGVMEEEEGDDVSHTRRDLAVVSGVP